MEFVMRSEKQRWLVMFRRWRCLDKAILYSKFILDKNFSHELGFDANHVLLNGSLLSDFIIEPFSRGQQCVVGVWF